MCSFHEILLRKRKLFIFNCKLKMTKCNYKIIKWRNYFFTVHADEVDRIVLQKPIIPIKKPGLGSAMSRNASAVSRNLSAQSANSGIC